MPVFEYRAYDAQGKVKEGILDADTAREARVRLRDQKVHVIDLRAKQITGGKARMGSPRMGWGRALGPDWEIERIIWRLK